MKQAVKLVLVLVLSSVLLYGCGGASGSSGPDWVIKGQGAFDAEGTKVFYSVGSAYGIKNPSLLRQTADNRAINAMGKVFEVYTASLAKDYMASTIANDPTVSSEEQHVEQAIKTLTKATLSGVAIIDHWTDKSSGEMFSLARLDMEKFMDSLNKMKELDQKVKEHIKKNANRLHDELNKELDKAE